MKFFEPQGESFVSRTWYAFGQLLSFFPARDYKRRDELEQLRQYYATRDDKQVLSQDWQRVGSSIQKAMDTYPKPEDPKGTSQD